MTRDQFGKWLSGFIDGEGNFQVWVERGRYLRVAFRLHLHIDDVAVLYKIQAYLGVGTVTMNTANSTCTFRITNVSDIVSVLLPFLAAYPLQTVKQYDCHDFRAMVLLLVSRATMVLTPPQLADALVVIRGMNSGRINYPVPVLPAVIDPFWLLGFIEGEGTFGLKSLIPYFQLGQHVRNTALMHSIGLFLEGLPNGFGYSLHTLPLLINFTLNKTTGVLVLSNANVDSLFDILAHYLLGLPFQTRKETDFLYWCLVLYLRKYGYFYLDSGRQLAVAIAAYINKSRYSNAKSVPAEPTIPSDLLSSSPPVELEPGMTHAQLARLTAKTLGNKSYWVYDQGTLVPGSPFATQPAALQAIGKPGTSSAVRRYLDSGKVYDGRFVFTSRPRV